MNLNEKAQGKNAGHRVRFARGMTWLFLGACTLLLAYTFYQAEVTFQGEMNEKYFKYYVISIAGICFWGAVSRLGDGLKIKIVVVATSLVVGLLLAEMILSFMDPRGDLVATRAAAAKEAGMIFDTRSKLQVYQDLRREGVDAVPTVHPSFFIATNGVAGGGPLYPFGGVSRKTTVFCNESGKRSVFLSDRYGFNNPDSEWDLPRTEWVITGDSYAQGACVDPGEEIAGQIRSITGESVINLGSSGNGPLIDLAVLKEYAESRTPTNVLWVYCEVNDPVDLVEEKEASLLMRYLQPGFCQGLIQRQTEIDDRLLRYIAEAEVKEEKAKLKKAWTRLVRFLRFSNIRQRLDFDDFDPYVDPYVDPLFHEVLKKARDWTVAWGGELYFVYLPDYERYAEDVQNPDLYMKRKAVSSAVVEVVEGLDIPVIDIHQEVFAGHPDWRSLFPLRIGGHYNAEGFSEVSEAIVSGVRKIQQRHSGADKVTSASASSG